MRRSLKGMSRLLWDFLMNPPEVTSTTNPPQPHGDEAAPRPTYAPIAMAMGVAMTAWGLMAASLNISAVSFMSVGGVGLIVWALRSWIGEIVLQWEEADEHDGK